MCRSDPQMPVAWTRTIASSGAWSSGFGRSSTATRPGSWNVTASMRRQARRRRSFPLGRYLVRRQPAERDGADAVLVEAKVARPRAEQLADAARRTVPRVEIRTRRVERL